MKHILSHLEKTIAVSACVVSSFLFVNLLMPATPTAQAEVRNYSSKWTATRLIRAEALEQGTAKMVTNIGVAQWKVSGQLAGATTRFSETWDVSGGENMQVKIQYKNINIDQDPLVIPSVGTDRSKFLVYAPSVYWRYFGGDYDFGLRDGSMRFRTVPNPNKIPGFGNGNQGVDTVLNTEANIPCSKVYSMCLSTSGSYGYVVDVYAGGSSSWGDHQALGLFQPLEWTINGSVCTEGEATCN